MFKPFEMLSHRVASMFALPLPLESHRLHDEVDDPMQTAFGIFRLAMFLTEAGTAEAAVTMLAAADAYAADAGVELTNWDRVVGECLAKLDEQRGDDAFEDARERGRQLIAQEAFELALENVPSDRREAGRAPHLP